jgi:hypothetical protein
MNSGSASEHLKPGYEIVFTVTDYYDGSRGGIANFRGKPHLYKCVFDQTANDYSDTYSTDAHKVTKCSPLRWRNGKSGRDRKCPIMPAKSRSILILRCRMTERGTEKLH